MANIVETIAPVDDTLNHLQIVITVDAIDPADVKNLNNRLRVEVKQHVDRDDDEPARVKRYTALLADIPGVTTALRSQLEIIYNAAKAGY